MGEAQSERMPARGRRRLLPWLLLIVLIACLVLAPVIAVFVALAVAIHAHLAGIPWLRNVAIAAVVLSLVLVLLGGVGGSVSGGLVD
jgi:hypothetical protein